MHDRQYHAALLALALLVTPFPNLIAESDRGVSNYLHVELSAKELEAGEPLIVSLEVGAGPAGLFILGEGLDGSLAVFDPYGIEVALLAIPASAIPNDDGYWVEGQGNVTLDPLTIPTNSSTGDPWESGAYALVVSLPVTVTETQSNESEAIEILQVVRVFTVGKEVPPPHRLSPSIAIQTSRLNGPAGAPATISVLLVNPLKTPISFETTSSTTILLRAWSDTGGLLDDLVLPVGLAPGTHTVHPMDAIVLLSTPFEPTTPATVMYLIRASTHDLDKLHAASGAPVSVLEHAELLLPSASGGPSSPQSNLSLTLDQEVVTFGSGSGIRVWLNLTNLGGTTLRALLCCTPRHMVQIIDGNGSIVWQSLKDELIMTDPQTEAIEAGQTKRLVDDTWVVPISWNLTDRSRDLEIRAMCWAARLPGIILNVSTGEPAIIGEGSNGQNESTPSGMLTAPPPGHPTSTPVVAPAWIQTPGGVGALAALMAFLLSIIGSQRARRMRDPLVR